MYGLFKSSASDDGPLFTAAATAAATDSAVAASHAEPSTSRVDPDGDNAETPNNNYLDFSSDDDGDSEDVFYGILSRYMCKRNITIDEIYDPERTSKNIITYVNLKYVESNFKTIGVNKTFNNNSVTKAYMEFESFEKWIKHYIESKKSKKKFVKELRVPIFSHLYLSLYSENNRERLHAFLNAFKYLFSSSKVFLEELRNVTDINNLSPYLSLFRKNKYVLITLPEFLTNLFTFFEHHNMLKVVFQEWFDINYSTTEKSTKIYQEYYDQHESDLMNQIIARISKLNNEVDVSSVSNNNLNGNQKPNSLEKNSQPTVDFQNNIPIDEIDKYKCELKNKTNDESESKPNDGPSTDTSEDSSFSDEEILNRKYINKKKKSNVSSSYKTSSHMKVSYNTKIEAKNLDDDSYLTDTRQISLTNCNKLSCTILTSDHKYVAAGTLDSLIYLWERTKFDIETFLYLPSEKSNNFIEYLDRSSASVLHGHGGSVFDLAEIPKAKLLLSASSDKTFRAWDLKSKRCVEIYNEYEHRTWCIAACPTSLQVVTGSCDGIGCLWFLNYKRPLRFFVGHLEDILVVKFHPNQALLATGSSDKTIRVFELVTGDCQRLLLGHSDYISCLEFHMKNPNILASACGAGEIIVWNLPCSKILWRLKVTKVLFSDIVWLTDEILLASVNTGTILKCDTNKNYVNTVEKVDGFATKLNRLMSMKIVDNIVYTIGIPDKSNVPADLWKSSQTTESKSAKIDPPTSSQSQQKPRRVEQATPPLAQRTTENGAGGSGNSAKPSSVRSNSASNLQQRRSMNMRVTPSPPDFSQTNLQQRVPIINLTGDDTEDLCPEYQSVINRKSGNIRLIKKPAASKKSTAAVQKDIVQATTGGNPSKNNARHRQLGQSTTTTTTTKTMTTTMTTKKKPETKRNAYVPPQKQQQKPIIRHQRNVVVQQQLAQQLQPQLQIRPRLSTAATQLVQKNVVPSSQKQQEQQQQLLVGTVVQQPSIFQQSIRANSPATLLGAKVSQRQQTANAVTTFGAENVASSSTKTNAVIVRPSSSTKTNAAIVRPPSSVVRLAIRPQKQQQHKQKKHVATTTNHQTLEKMPPDDYARLREVVMSSLLQNNPEMFARGQTVIGEITRSHPSATIQSIDLTESNVAEDENPDGNFHSKTNSR